MTSEVAPFNVEKHLESLRDQMATSVRSLSMVKGCHLGEDHPPILAHHLQTAVHKLSTLEDAVQWKRGDWIAAAKKDLGPMQAYRLAAAAMGRSTRLAFELAKVSETFGPEVRYAGIPWTLYRACANTDDPKEWLSRALLEGLTPAGIRKRRGKAQLKDAASAEIRNLFNL